MLLNDLLDLYPINKNIQCICMIPSKNFAYSTINFIRFNTLPAQSPNVEFSFQNLRSVWDPPFDHELVNSIKNKNKFEKHTEYNRKSNTNSASIFLKICLFHKPDLLDHVIVRSCGSLNLPKNELLLALFLLLVLRD